MKGKQIQLFLLLAVLSIILGLIAKFAGAKIFVQAFTWVEVAQTCLLFGIALGISGFLEKGSRE